MFHVEVCCDAEALKLSQLLSREGVFESVQSVLSRGAKDALSNHIREAKEFVRSARQVRSKGHVAGRGR